MLVIQRPTVEALGDEEATGSGSPSAPSSPASATPSATRSAARCCRRSPARPSPRCASTTPCTSSTPSRRRRGRHRHHPQPQGPRDSCHTDEPVTLRLDVRGPADVTAGDIQTPAEIEILNKDLHLATLSTKGRLAFDITIGRGRGYVSADGRHQAPSASSPSTPSSRPVRRVAIEVEPTRVEQSTNFDRLVLDIETDGSITPRDALASAGATLRSLVQLVEEMSDARRASSWARSGRAGRLAGPRPAHRGARPVRAAPQLPQAGADQHHRRAPREDRGRPPGHHELRPEVARRGDRQARRARPVAAQTPRGLIGDHAAPHEGPRASAATPPTRRR